MKLLPGGRDHYPITFAATLRDRWGRVNPGFVILIGWRNDMQAMIAASVRRPIDNDGHCFGRFTYMRMT